jgi:hypothetical protein
MSEKLLQAAKDAVEVLQAAVRFANIVGCGDWRNLAIQSHKAAVQLKAAVSDSEAKEKEISAMCESDGYVSRVVQSPETRFSCNTELLRQALEQLEINRTNMNRGMSKSIGRCLAGGNDEIIKKLQEALSKPEPEPVAFVKESPFCPEGLSDELSKYLPEGMKLFAQPRREPLAPEKIEEIFPREWPHNGDYVRVSPQELTAFVRAVEQAHHITEERHDRY